MNTVHIDSVSHGRAIVKVDGRPVPHIAGYQVSGQIGLLCNVTLDLRIPVVQLTAEARVVVDAKTAELLTAIGWTAPAAATEETIRMSEFDGYEFREFRKTNDHDLETWLVCTYDGCRALIQQAKHGASLPALVDAVHAHEYATHGHHQ